MSTRSKTRSFVQHSWAVLTLEKKLIVFQLDMEQNDLNSNEEIDEDDEDDELAEDSSEWL